ncbi:hypothetical protein BV898_03443 [Hypsibius exemplaris]|uniref:Chitin-binding type-2 domain-containing protein n=1 Tax=Hypsibius exemplaris TaxID=2072580 RepID=A0A1W0X5D9_HYPEX|nr:hypothetical protein BV898_03443 [Hypsibius exemplaris]
MQVFLLASVVVLSLVAATNAYDNYPQRPPSAVHKSCAEGYTCRYGYSCVDYPNPNYASCVQTEAFFQFGLICRATLGSCRRIQQNPVVPVPEVPEVPKSSFFRNLLQ